VHRHYIPTRRTIIKTIVWVAITLIILMITTRLLLKYSRSMLVWYEYRRTANRLKRTVPPTVLSKYREGLTGRGSTIEICDNDTEKIYIVSHENISPTYYYFSDEGTLIGTYFTSDVLDVHDTNINSPPFEKERYMCKLLS